MEKQVIKKAIKILMEQKKLNQAFSKKKLPDFPNLENCNLDTKAFYYFKTLEHKAFKTHHSILLDIILDLAKKDLKAAK